MGHPVPPPAPYHASAVQRPSMLPPSVGTLKSETYGSSQEFPPRAPRFPPHFSSDLSLVPPSSDPASTPASAQPYPHPTPSLGHDRSSQLSSALLVQDARSSQLTAQSGSGSIVVPSSLPALSQPTSTAVTLAPLPSLPPTATATQRDDDESEKRACEAFLESLREVPELYNLTRRELENLVSIVVREPGFAKLVRSLAFCLSRFFPRRLKEVFFS